MSDISPANGASETIYVVEFYCAEGWFVEGLHETKDEAHETIKRAKDNTRFRTFRIATYRREREEAAL